MAATDPRDVVSPKKYVSKVDVIYAGGEDRWSVARLDWDGKPSLGIRWNGNAENPLGNPQSRGIPTWFIVPDDLQDVVERAVRELSSPLDAAYAEMARDEAGETAAEEWSDALVGDAAGSPDEAW
jgi:hypothetical protein